MRRLHKPRQTAAKSPVSGTPLAESIIPLNARGQCDWNSLNADEIVAFTKKAMKEEGLGGKKEFEKAYRGAYANLKRRKLLDRVGFEEKQRRRRKWKDMSDKELIGYARKLMEEKGITGRWELGQADQGLYVILKKRKVIDKIEFEVKERKWRELSDEELVERAKRFMKKRRITGSKEFENADKAFYQVLRGRRLLDEVGFVRKKKKARNWKELSDDELVAYAKRFMRRNGIEARTELQKLSRDIYYILWKRKLLDRLAFSKKQRNWKDMSDDELVAYAKRFVEEHGINTRSELRDMDRRLSAVLRRRNLHDRVFSDIEETRTRDARLKVVEALEKFGTV